MLITITLEPDSGRDLDATVLSHLLRKHPGKAQSFQLPVGTAHVFYPEYGPRRCTAALLLEVDPVGLVRSKRFRGEAGVLDHYINDRPYAASSLLSVALGKVMRSAMSGQSESHPELATAPLPLKLAVPVISTRADADGDLVRRLFEPLGWHIESSPIELDENYPQWGASHYRSLELTGNVPLHLALRQLYVLMPVLDDAKHYWVGDDEAAKLVRQGEGWLAEHPERELIAHRYLAHQRDLVEVARELGVSGTPEVSEQATETTDQNNPAVPLRILRAEAVLGALHETNSHSVVDAGCGPGALLRRLQKDGFFTRIVGTDVSGRALERAAADLHLAERSDVDRERLQLLHSSAVYRDERLRGFDAIVLMEVIEHLDPERLPALVDSIFGYSQPRTVLVTTPNAEFNALYPRLASGTMRHDDHRFEWNRDEFRRWAENVATEHGYAVDYRSIGNEHEQLGPATQMAIFRKVAA
ncbi:3' terminal RNA ribose 2'-O-methyltransferase Hen1 [Glutamicibacter endophyticus]